VASKREQLRAERAARRAAAAEHQEAAPAPQAERDFLAQGPDEDFSVLARERGLSRRLARRRKAAPAPAPPQPAEAVPTREEEVAVPKREAAPAPEREEVTVDTGPAPTPAPSEDDLLLNVVSALLKPEGEALKEVEIPLEQAAAPQEAPPVREVTALKEASPPLEVVEEVSPLRGAAEVKPARKARRAKEATAERAAARAAAREAALERKAARTPRRTAEEAKALKEERWERWSFLAQPRTSEYTAIASKWWWAALFVAAMLLAGALLWAVPNAYLIPKDREYGIHSLAVGVIIGLAFWWKAGKKHGTRLAVQASLTTFFALFIGEFLHWFFIVTKNAAFRTIFFDLISFKFLWENGAEVLKNTVEAMFPVAFLWILLLPSATAFLIGFGMPPIPEIIFQIGRALRGQSPKEKEAGHGLEG
jgi:hypothetical protein